MPNQKQLLKALKRQGCLVEHTGSGHIRITLPQGDTIILAHSPSDRRAWLNDRARLRRAGVAL